MAADQVELARRQQDRWRGGAGCHGRVIFRLDGGDPPRAAVGLLGGAEPGRVGVLLDEDPLIQGVDGQVHLAEDQQEVAAFHLVGEAAAIMMSGECCRAPLQVTGRAGKHSAALALISSAVTWCLRSRTTGRVPAASAAGASHARRGEPPNPRPPPPRGRWPDAIVSSRCSGTGPPPSRRSPV